MMIAQMVAIALREATRPPPAMWKRNSDFTVRFNGCAERLPVDCRARLLHYGFTTDCQKRIYGDA